MRTTKINHVCRMLVKKRCHKYRVVMYICETRSVEDLGNIYIKVFIFSNQYLSIFAKYFLGSFVCRLQTKSLRQKCTSQILDFGNNVYSTRLRNEFHREKDALCERRCNEKCYSIAIVSICSILGVSCRSQIFPRCCLRSLWEIDLVTPDLVFGLWFCE